MIRLLMGTSLACLLTACVTTNTMPLSQNTLRLDTEAGGLLFVGSANQVTMMKAGEETLARGYTHFRIADSSVSQGRELSGVISQSSGSATGYRTGNTVFASGRSTGFATPVYRPTTSVGVIIEMYGPNDPMAQGAFDAAEVVRRKGHM